MNFLQILVKRFILEFKLTGLQKIVILIHFDLELVFNN